MIIFFTWAQLIPLFGGMLGEAQIKELIKEYLDNNIWGGAPN